MQKGQKNIMQQSTRIHGTALMEPPSISTYVQILINRDTNVSQSSFSFFFLIHN